MIKNKNLFVVAYIVLFLFAIVTLSYRETGAKFHKAEMNVLSYGAKFKKMTGELVGYIDTDKVNGSNYQTLKYIIEFDKSNNMNDDDTKDKYDIKLSNDSCSIVSLSTEGITPDSVSSDNKQIIYSRQDENTGTIKAVISCNIEKIKNNDKLEFSLDIDESFNEESFDYLYIHHDFEISAAEYDSKFPNPLPDDIVTSDNEIKIPRTHSGDNAYLELITWLKQKVEKVTNDSNYVVSYVHSFPSLSEIESITKRNVKKFKEVDGIIEAAADDDYYVFQIDNKFANYVMTSGNVSSTKKQFYFYNIEDNDVDSIFKYYITKYLYSNDSQKVSDVMTKIESFENKNISLSNIIKLSQVQDLGMDYLENCLIVPENLYDILNNGSNKIKLKDIVDQNDMNEKFKLLFNNENTKDDILTYLNGKYVLYHGEQYESYNIFLDNDKNLLVHIFFDEGTNDIVPHVEVETLTKDQQTLTFNLQPFIGEDSDRKERFRQELNNIVNELYNGEYKIVGNQDVQDLFTDLTPDEYQIMIGIDGSGTISITLSDQAGYVVTLHVDSSSTISEINPEVVNEPEVNDNPSNE